MIPQAIGCIGQTTTCGGSTLANYITLTHAVGLPMIVISATLRTSIPRKLNGITNGDYLMQGLCQKAKDKGVIIYAIAVEAGSHGDQEMAKCASSTSHYFNVNGGELENVFSAIARQITDLRLAL